MYRRQAPKERRFDRLSIVTGLTAFALIVVVARLFQIQVLQHGFYKALAENQQAIAERITPHRGEIFFRDHTTPHELYPVATNRELRLVFSVPTQVTEPAATADALAPLLKMDAEEILRRVTKTGDQYEPLAHNVSVETADEIDALDLPGIRSTPELVRYYPFGAITGQLTGFLGYDGDARVGQYGIEGALEDRLNGVPGRLRTRTANLGSSGTIEEAQNGDNVVLSIDRTVQHTACTKLQEAVEKHGANRGDLVIVEPKTGAVLALCSYPNFDPNRYGDTEDLSLFSSGVIGQAYEPGSVMKTMTLSGAIDTGDITPETTFEDTGSIKIGSYTIRNAEDKKYGTQTMAQVLEQSINTGAIHVQQLLGLERFRALLERYGFGAKTGIEMEGEAAGDISSLSKSGDIYGATASFGQGITATPLQLVMAYAALANGGELMQPHVVAEYRKASGVTEPITPSVVRRVVSPEAARTMLAMLVNVVRLGHGQRAAVAGYYVGGKTGTAQIPLKDKAGYDPHQSIGTFIGFAPLSDPAFVMLTKIDVPRDVQFAESSAAPLFGSVMSFLMQYYEIPPDDRQ